MKNPTTLTQEITAAVNHKNLSAFAAYRIPIIVLLESSLVQALRQLKFALQGETDVRMEDVLVISNQAKCQDWPDSLRHRQVQYDELTQAKGCLCCSIGSELATTLSHIFLQLLRRLEPKIRLVVIVTTAQDVEPLRETLQHAPFLSQRYRLAAQYRAAITHA